MMIGVNMKAILVYYSQTGNTEKTANLLTESIEKKDIKVTKVSLERSEESSYEEDVEDAKKEALAEIKTTKTDLSEYDLLLIGTPVWCGKPATPVNTFMEKCEGLEGMKIATFLTHGGGGSAMTFDKIEDELGPKGGEFVGRLELSSDEIENEVCRKKIEEFVSIIL